MKPIILLQTPFFKAVGSHNNRIGLELCYASRYLEEAGIEHIVLNGDYSDTSIHLPWRSLFENMEYFRAACDGQSPVIDQCVEEVLQFDPEMVVVAAGDNYIPTKNFGSPYIAYQVAWKLRRYAKVIGIGPQFTRDPQLFREPFDGRFFRGPVDRSIVDVVSGGKQGPRRKIEDILPQFRYTYPKGQTTDYVMSSYGCAHQCDFCYCPVVWKKVHFRKTESFIRDIHTRILTTKRTSLYIADMHFPARFEHLAPIAEILDGFPYEFTCESRLKMLSDREAELLKKIGVKTVKLGIEALDNRVLKRMKKGQTVRKVKEAIKSFKKAGFKLVGYLLFGSYYEGDVEAMRRTIDEADKIQEIDYWVINVASFSHLDWKHKYDSHFSLIAAEQQDVPAEVLFDAMRILQEERTNPTVRVVEGR